MNGFSFVVSSLRSIAVLLNASSLKSACSAVALSVICSVCLAGCVSSLWPGKTKANVDTKSAGRGAAVKENTVSPAPTPAKPSQGGDKSGAEARGQGAAEKGRNPGPTKETKDSAEPASKPQPSKSPTQSPDDQDNLSDSFKKHDHSKYMTYVRNKAIDLINTQKPADHVVLCKDNTTDQWTMTLYNKGDRVYSFVTYVWDEIDDKWTESFVSNKNPISRWKNHVRYSASGKDCTVLKGRREGE